MMESENFVPEELRRLNALANAATRRLEELLESEKDTSSPSKSPSPRNKRERKNFMRSADYEEVEEEEYSFEKAVAANKRRKCGNTNYHIINIPKIKNKKKVVAVDDGGLHPPPPLPEDFKKVIQQIAQEGGGKTVSEEILVIQKGLFETDLAKTQNRLSIPFSKVCDHKFLTEEEAHFLTLRDENKKMKYKEVTIIEPCLRREKAKLSRWDMNKDNGRNTSSHYVINGTWRHIVDRNKLKPHMVVQLWSFRVDQELHLALVRLPS